LNGGEGHDQALFSGNREDYTITRNEDGSYRVSGTDGVDTLTGIESIRFDDGEVSLQAPMSNVTPTGSPSGTNSESSSEVDQAGNTVMPELSGSMSDTDTDSERERNRSRRTNTDQKETDDFFATFANG